MENGPKRCFENIAKLVRISRLNHPKRYSQTELSAFLGYKNGQFISNVERGICSIPAKSLKKIADLLEISPQSLKDAILKDHEVTIDNYLSHYAVESTEATSEVGHVPSHSDLLQESYI